MPRGHSNSNLLNIKTSTSFRDASRPFQQQSIAFASIREVSLTVELHIKALLPLEWFQDPFTGNLVYIEAAASFGDVAKPFHGVVIHALV